MTPRRYDMSKRELAREQTRRRIVEATAKLHGEHGIFGTSWKDIADEADVSPATVYAHFSSLEELLPACGALVMERAKPPRPESAKETVGDAQGLEERLLTVANELFAFYERGGAQIEVDVRERRLPGVREWERYLMDLVAAFVREALAPASADAHTARLVSGLLDLPTFKALRARGVAVDTAARAMALAATALVQRPDAGKRNPKEER